MSLKGNERNIMAQGDLVEAARALTKEDLEELVGCLSSKDDKARYQAFLLLQSRSLYSPDVYPYWSTFQSKLQSSNSYQRSLGVMLLAENVKWDVGNQIDSTIDECLLLLNDEKLITRRQCIEALGKIALEKPHLDGRISSALISLNLTAVKETMRKSMLLDILKVLCSIRKRYKTSEIESFITNALASGILDTKAKKQVENLIQGT